MSILICYDGSPNAKHAISVAAATLRGEGAILLHIYNPPVAFLADSFGDPGLSGPTLDELERLSLERAHQIAHEGEELARADGLSVTVRVERAGKGVWHTILDVAETVDAQLIVVGTRGHTALESSLLGSVSATIVHNSVRPLLIVPAV